MKVLTWMSRYRQFLQLHDHIYEPGFVLQFGTANKLERPLDKCGLKTTLLDLQDRIYKCLGKIAI